MDNNKYLSLDNICQIKKSISMNIINWNKLDTNTKCKIKEEEYNIIIYILYKNENDLFNKYKPYVNLLNIYNN
jgi:hypothetical protein